MDLDLEAAAAAADINRKRARVRECAPACDESAEELRRRLHHLTHESLPRLALMQRWGCRSPSDLSRVVLDNTFNAVWYDFLRKDLSPFHQMTATQLRAALHIAQLMQVHGAACVAVLNGNSLRWRGQYMLGKGARASRRAADAAHEAKRTRHAVAAWAGAPTRGRSCSEECDTGCGSEHDSGDDSGAPAKRACPASGRPSPCTLALPAFAFAATLGACVPGHQFSAPAPSLGGAPASVALHAQPAPYFARW